MNIIEEIRSFKKKLITLLFLILIISFSMQVNSASKKESNKEKVSPSTKNDQLSLNTEQSYGKDLPLSVYLETSTNPIDDVCNIIDANLLPREKWQQMLNQFINSTFKISASTAHEIFTQLKTTNYFFVEPDSISSNSNNKKFNSLINKLGPDVYLNRPMLNAFFETDEKQNKSTILLAMILAEAINSADKGKMNTYNKNIFISELLRNAEFYSNKNGHPKYSLKDKNTTELKVIINNDLKASSNLEIKSYNLSNYFEEVSSKNEPQTDKKNTEWVNLKKKSNIFQAKKKQSIAIQKLIKYNDRNNNIREIFNRDLNFTNLEELYAILPKSMWEQKLYLTHYAKNCNCMGKPTYIREYKVNLKKIKEIEAFLTDVPILCKPINE